MKTLLLISFVSLVASFAFGQAPTVVERGPHHRIWERTITETRPNGRVVERKSSYTELGTGMHYWKEGQWQESQARFRIFPGGAVANEGPFQFIIAPDIAAEGAVDLLTPDGKRFLSSPRWLAYHDLDTGQSLIIAAVKSCAGQMFEPNVIVFPDAFDDVKAALRYTYQPWGVEQDVILIESGSLKPEDHGFNPQNHLVLEMWSEFQAAPETARATPVVEDGLADVRLSFGEAQIGTGKAFSLSDEEESIAVGKTWTQVEQRQFLIEAVRVTDLAPLLARLPQHVQANNPGQRVRAMAQQQPVGNRTALLAQGVERLRAGEKRLQTASIRPGQTPLKQGVVLDYSIITTASDVRLKGDTTYYVTNSVTLSGTTIIEGGTVIKFANVTNSGSNKILITGAIDCRTSAYHPAIFTAKDDDTVGDTISGSSGSPGTNRYAGRALELNAANTAYDLHDLRFRYPAIAVYVSASSVTSVLSHVQVGFANTAINNIYANGYARNLLVFDTLTGISSGATGTNRLEHATFHRVGTFRDTGTVYLTNSLLISVTNGMTYTGANNATNISDSGIFQTVGAATHYLANSSTNLNAGTTNINTTLLAALKKRTTYPPIVIGDGSWYTNSLTLNPQAQRDTDTPDLGYHYESLDYVFSALPLTNATITVMSGVAIGTRTLNSYGLGLLGGAQFICEGTPDNLNRIVRYNTVQEQANTNWIESASYGSSVITAWTPPTTTAPFARVRFTDWSVPTGGPLYHFWGYLEDAGTHDLRDCEFHSGVLYTQRPSLGVTNCLFNRTQLVLEENYDMNHIFRNCTFAGSDLQLVHAGSGSWTFQNNLFDGTTTNNTEGYFTNSYNGYTTNAARLVPTNVTDVKLSVTNIAYDTGWLGRFYLPTNLTSHSKLFDTGSTNADRLGFYHYTTVTNQTRELTSTNDLGFHYVAVNSSGVPIDTDGDGWPNYYEDANGNGSVDSGETDWQTANDWGLRIFITRPRNGGNIP